ncbi:MAG: helix-turn-helix domain-containing protein [Bacillota bacterium]|jgi:excisionase family DNA binding protein
MFKLLSAKQVAEIFQEKKQWVYMAAREGILPAVRCGRKIKFSEKAILEFIERGGQALPGGWKKEA